MKLEIIVRRLKENNNCYISESTLKKIGKKNIEQECGFEIEIKLSATEGYYILERKE